MFIFRCNVDRSDLVEYYIASLKKIFFTCTDNFNPQMEENDQQKLMIQYMEVIGGYLNLFKYNIYIYIITFTHYTNIF